MAANVITKANNWSCWQTDWLNCPNVPDRLVSHFVVIVLNYVLLIDSHRYLFSQAIRWKTHVDFDVNGFDFFHIQTHLFPRWGDAVAALAITSHHIHVCVYAKYSYAYAHKTVGTMCLVWVWASALFTPASLYKYIQEENEKKQDFEWKHTKAHRVC